MKRRRLAAILAALATLAAAIAAPTSLAATSVVTGSARGDAGVRDFWTTARLRRARPLSIRRAGSAPPVRPTSVRPSHETPHRYPARAPLAGAAASATFETVPDPDLPGLAQNGAIFFSLGDGEGFARCSGTSVNAPNLSVVFTAGHCVNEGGGLGHWYQRKWVFIPGYHNGIRPYGTFVAHWLGSTKGWLANGNENFDMGAAVVSRNERGQRLGAAVGGAGFAWGLPPGQVFDIYGYPVGPPFNGATLKHCAQTPFEGHDWASFLWPGPLDLAVQCNVTGGASGGGWLIAGGALNGVTTYGYDDDPATDYGPYFGKAAGRLYEEARRVR